MTSTRKNALTADDIKVGHTYRGKRPRQNFFGDWDDRTVLHLNPGRGPITIVQYDSITVKDGAHFPTREINTFLNWARTDVTEEVQTDG